MSGADERVRPSKREAEQAVIISCVAGRIVRPRWCTARMCGAISHCLRAWPLTPLPLPLGGLTRDAARSSATVSRVCGGVSGREATRRDDRRARRGCHPLSASEIVAKLRAGAAQSPRSLPHLDCCRGLFAILGPNQLWQSLARRLELAPRRLAVARLATSREQRDGASAHDERSYRLATVIA